MFYILISVPTNYKTIKRKDSSEIPQMTFGLYFQGLPPVALLDNEGSALWPNYQCILAHEL